MASAPDHHGRDTSKKDVHRKERTAEPQLSKVDNRVPSEADLADMAEPHRKGGGSDVVEARIPRESDTPPATCSVLCGPRPCGPRSCSTLPSNLNNPGPDSSPSEPKRRRLWGLRGLVKMFRRKVRRKGADRSTSPNNISDSHLRTRSNSELGTDQPGRSLCSPYTQVLSVSHDSVFSPESPTSDSELKDSQALSAKSGINMSELKAVLRQRVGSSTEGEHGLAMSPGSNSPTHMHDDTHVNKGSRNATRSTCSDASLLSMGSSDNEEDSMGGYSSSFHSSKASLGDGSVVQHHVDPDPVLGSAPLSHTAARHKISVRPKRTHRVMRQSKSITQTVGTTSLPATPEVNEVDMGGGQRPQNFSAKHQLQRSGYSASAVEGLYRKKDVASSPPWEMEPTSPEEPRSPHDGSPKKDEPFFNRLFGSSRESSLSPLRRAMKSGKSKRKSDPSRSEKIDKVDDVDKSNNKRSSSVEGRLEGNDVERKYHEDMPSSKRLDVGERREEGYEHWELSQRTERKYEVDSHQWGSVETKKSPTRGIVGGSNLSKRNTRVYNAKKSSGVTRLSSSYNSLDYVEEIHGPIGRVDSVENITQTDTTYSSTSETSAKVMSKSTISRVSKSPPSKPPHYQRSNRHSLESLAMSHYGRSSMDPLSSTPLSGVYIRPQSHVETSDAGIMGHGISRLGDHRTQGLKSPRDNEIPMWDDNRIETDVESGPLSLDSSITLVSHEDECIRKAISVDQVCRINHPEIKTKGYGYGSNLKSPSTEVKSPLKSSNTPSKQGGMQSKSYSGSLIETGSSQYSQFVQSNVLSNTSVQQINDDEQILEIGKSSKSTSVVRSISMHSPNTSSRKISMNDERDLERDDKHVKKLKKEQSFSNASDTEDKKSTKVPEFMRIQLNKVENKANNSVVFDTEVKQETEILGSESQKQKVQINSVIDASKILETDKGRPSDIVKVKDIQNVINKPQVTLPKAKDVEKVIDLQVSKVIDASSREHNNSFSGSSNVSTDGLSTSPTSKCDDKLLNKPAIQTRPIVKSKILNEAIKSPKPVTTSTEPLIDSLLDELPPKIDIEMRNRPEIEIKHPIYLPKMEVAMVTPYEGDFLTNEDKTDPKLRNIIDKPIDTSSKYKSLASNYEEISKYKTTTEKHDDSYTKYRNSLNKHDEYLLNRKNSMDKPGDIEISKSRCSSRSQDEEIVLRRPSVVDRSSVLDQQPPTSPIPQKSDQPELFKVFARRSFKIKENDLDINTEYDDALSSNEIISLDQSQNIDVLKDIRNQVAVDQEKDGNFDKVISVSEPSQEGLKGGCEDNLSKKLSSHCNEDISKSVLHKPTVIVLSGNCSTELPKDTNCETGNFSTAVLNKSLEEDSSTGVKGDTTSQPAKIQHIVLKPSASFKVTSPISKVARSESLKGPKEVDLSGQVLQNPSRRISSPISITRISPKISPNNSLTSAKGYATKDSKETNNTFNSTIIGRTNVVKAVDTQVEKSIKNVRPVVSPTRPIVNRGTSLQWPPPAGQEKMSSSTIEQSMSPKPNVIPSQPRIVPVAFKPLASPRPSLFQPGIMPKPAFIKKDEKLQNQSNVSKAQHSPTGSNSQTGSLSSRIVDSFESSSVQHSTNLEDSSFNVLNISKNATNVQKTVNKRIDGKSEPSVILRTKSPISTVNKIPKKIESEEKENKPSSKEQDLETEVSFSKEENDTEESVLSVCAVRRRFMSGSSSSSASVTTPSQSSVSASVSSQINSNYKSERSTSNSSSTSPLISVSSSQNKLTKSTIIETSTIISNNKSPKIGSIDTSGIILAEARNTSSFSSPSSAFLRSVSHGGEARNVAAIDHADDHSTLDDSALQTSSGSIHSPDPSSPANQTGGGVSNSIHSRESRHSIGSSGGSPNEDWRVLVRQRREDRLRQTKTPDMEEMMMEGRQSGQQVSPGNRERRESKVLEIASNFQKLQVA